MISVRFEDSQFHRNDPERGEVEISDLSVNCLPNQLLFVPTFERLMRDCT